MSEQRLLTYVDALREAVSQEMKRDPNVFVFGLDTDDHKAIQGSTRGLVEEFGPDRVFGTPLSEDAMTGVAIGAAMAGMRPIHVHIRMDFLMLAMNQLINIAAKGHYMYGGQINVPLVVRSMIGKSWGQGAQHSQGLHSMFMHVPGLKVVAPSNAHDAKGCLIAAIRDDNPVIFVEHRLLYFTDSYVPEQAYEVPFGKARVCTTGNDVTVVGISNMLMECLRASELLKDVGIEAEIIDPISLVPLDIETIRNSVQRTGRLLVVDNAWTNCGASAEIVARIAEGNDGARTIQIRRMGYAPTTCPTTPVLEREFYPDPVKIAKMVYAMVQPNGPAWTLDPKRAELAYQSKFRGPF
jgi:pyruvate/2-oxoglutarate/acetoin dehydrogenase E1 component